VTYTLAADGASDRVLLPIITWSIKQFDVEPVVEQWRISVAFLANRTLRSG